MLKEQEKDVNNHFPARGGAGSLLAFPLPPLTAHCTSHREGWNQWNQRKSDNLLNLK